MPAENEETWTIDKIKTTQVRMTEGELKKPHEIHGIVDYPLWDFVEVMNYIAPVLHAAEIGLCNDALDSFLDFVDDRVESLSDEEMTARNEHVVADVAFDCAVKKLNEFMEDGAFDLLSYHM